MVGSGREIRCAMLGTQHRVVASLLHVHAGAVLGHDFHPLRPLFQRASIGCQGNLLEQQAQHQQKNDPATVAGS
jgi:hypothetical protein